MENFYSEALKAGQKQYRADVAAGRDPYLRCMEDSLPAERKSNMTNVGVIQIPAEFIIGTASTGRTTTFARNFMPLAGETTEFAGKWRALCDSHLKEGIHDPIQAFEFMNRYYVIEGNKRVSVLKFFGAVNIAAEVKRILPVRNGDENVELYYEFLDFYKKTGLNHIEFTEPGSYNRFLQLIGWNDSDAREEEILHLRTLFHYFRSAYRELGGEELELSVGDALLTYLNIYGYDSLRDMNEAQMKEAIGKVWQEIILKLEERPVRVVMKEEESSATLLSKLIPKPKTKIKAAFLYGLEPEKSDWVSVHEKGRQKAEQALGDQLETMVRICPDDASTDAAIQEAVESGAGVIFATSSQMENSCLKAAIENPKIPVLLCSLNVPRRSIRTYYPRMYEAKFISGALAGNLCTNGKIGYICKYPIYGMIAEINAFARGVQLSNANARVYLEWSENRTVEEITAEMTKQGIELISVRDFLWSSEQEKLLYGLRRVYPDGTSRAVVNAVCKWGIYYEKMIRSILNGTFKEQQEKTNRSLNYYWGMAEDVVDVTFADDLPRGTRYLGELIHLAIVKGVCRPFYNPGAHKDGALIWEDVKATLDKETIVKMDWLEDNIVGTIPDYEQLDDKARDLVDHMGVKPAKKTEPETR